MSIVDQVGKLFSTIVSSTIREQINFLRYQDIHVWDQAVRDSKEYCRMLGIWGSDLEHLEDLNSGISVPTPYGYVWLLYKNTCGSPYGSTWTPLLQARPAYREIVGIGGGTTFVAVLEDYEKEAVLVAIHEGKANVEKTDLRA